MTLSTAYSWVTILVCIGLFQHSVADLIISVRHKPIINFPITRQGLVSTYMRPFHFAYDGRTAWLLKIVTLINALVCIGLVVIGKNPLLPLSANFVIHLLTHPRWRYFVSSDSPLFRAILMALILHYALPSNRAISEAALLFIACYLVLIYFLTGVQKLKRGLWINGQAIENFMNRVPFWRMLTGEGSKPRTLMKFLAWTTLVFEVCFVVGIFVPEVAIVFAIAGLCFHGILSFTVGINHFFWTFIACYPAYLYISGRVPELLVCFTGF